MFVAETECIENMLCGLGVVVSLWFVGGMLVFVELVGYSIVGLSWLEVSVCIWAVTDSKYVEESEVNVAELKPGLLMYVNF